MFSCYYKPFNLSLILQVAAAIVIIGYQCFITISYHHHYPQILIIIINTSSQSSSHGFTVYCALQYSVCSTLHRSCFAPASIVLLIVLSTYSTISSLSLSFLHHKNHQYLQLPLDYQHICSLHTIIFNNYEIEAFMPIYSKHCVWNAQVKWLLSNNSGYRI